MATSTRLLEHPLLLMALFNPAKTSDKLLVLCPKLLLTRPCHPTYIFLVLHYFFFYLFYPWIQLLSLEKESITKNRP
jgi:hypothetical protein